jgi:hypothetical protein
MNIWCYNQLFLPYRNAESKEQKREWNALISDMVKAILEVK